MTDAYVVDERRGFYLSVWKETVAILFFVFSCAASSSLPCCRVLFLLVPHRYEIIVFSFSFVSRYLLISSLISLLTHSLFSSMLCRFQVFVCFLIFSLYLIFSCILWWSEKTLDMISILNSMRFVSGPNIVYLGKCSMCSWKEYILCCF